MERRVTECTILNVQCESLRIGKNIKPKSMSEIKSKYGCETLKSQGKVKIAS